jgi:serine/threonine protein kinase
VNAERYEEVRAIFLAACEQSESERASYIVQACGVDVELRAEVERLLPHLSRAQNFLSQPALGARIDLDDVEELAAGPGGKRRAPVTIGPYVLGRLLGEGGFGAVYEALQAAPVRRRVALKLLKFGMDSRQVLARFEAERQALALMDHPGIAKVLDAGETADGRPYFAMEFVDGKQLDEYCTLRGLSTRKRLALFLQVCEAIQHAHHKGVIHRDIKPSNVLVAEHDGRALPKVIDFGIAKAIEGSLGSGTLLTETGQFVGTPAYMSPEQVDARDVDTRTDVYSLGVLLYELIAGEPPFDAERLRRAGLAEIMRILREEEPPKPSTRASASGTAALPSSAASGRELRGDLDWIAMKALEKNRERRYATPSELAADVSRHLRSEPVSAGPPTAIYRMRKFARRNAAAVIAAGLTVAALLLGLVGTLWQYQHARTARDQALAAQSVADEKAREALAAEGLAKAKALEAQTKANTVLAVLQFIQDLFASVRPAVAQGHQPTVREVLDTASARLATDFGAEPAVEAEIRGIVGSVYRALGLSTQARPHLERALELRIAISGTDSPEALYSLNNLAALTAEEGNVVEAQKMYRESLATSRRVLGPEHLRTLTALNNLAQTYRQLGQPEEAAPLLREALELRMKTAKDDDAFALAARNNLAGVLVATGHVAEAEPVFRELLAIRRRTQGDGNPDTLDTLSNLAVVLAKLGRNDEAETLQREALDALLRIAGADHPQTLAARSNLAGILLAKGDASAAEAGFREVCDSCAKQYGANDSRTLDAGGKRAWALCVLERNDEAAALFRSAFDGLRKLFGEDHPSVLRAAVGLALTLGDDKSSEALELVRDALEGYASSADPEDSDALVAQHALAEILRKRGELAEAEEQARTVVDRARRSMPDGHWQRAIYEADWARCLVELKRYDEAEPLLTSSSAALARQLGAQRGQTLRAMALLEEVRRKRSSK